MFAYAIVQIDRRQIDQPFVGAMLECDREIVLEMYIARGARVVRDHRGSSLRFHDLRVAPKNGDKNESYR
jgi:hypothetical protein